MRRRANGGMRNYTEIFSNEIGDKMSGYVMGIDVNSGQPTRAVGPANNPVHTISGVRLTACASWNAITLSMRCTPIRDGSAKLMRGQFRFSLYLLVRA
jgi:hypothetical protein